MAFPAIAVVPTIGAHGHIVRLVEQLDDQGETDVVIVLDNGCDPFTAAWLEQHDLVQRVPMTDANIHRLWNAGLDAAAARCEQSNVAVLNDDIRIGPGFMAGLGAALRSHPNIAVVGPNYDKRPGTGLQLVFNICAGRYDGSGGLPGFAFMLRGESRYRFPENLTWWWGDADMVLTHRQLGEFVAIAFDVEVEHVDGGSQTGKWTSPAMREVLAADHATFMAKWERISEENRRALLHH